MPVVDGSDLRRTADWAARECPCKTARQGTPGARLSAVARTQPERSVSRDEEWRDTLLRSVDGRPAGASGLFSRPAAVSARSRVRLVGGRPCAFPGNGSITDPVVRDLKDTPSGHLSRSGGEPRAGLCLGGALLVLSWTRVSAVGRDSRAGPHASLRGRRLRSPGRRDPRPR